MKGVGLGIIPEQHLASEPWGEASPDGGFDDAVSHLELVPPK